MPSVGTLGMVVFLASLAMLFGGSIFAASWVWIRSPVWRHAQMPALPRTLWLSTAFVVATSALVHCALLAVRKNQQRVMRQCLAGGIALAIAFLVCQAWAWLQLAHSKLPVPFVNLYLFSVYMLTGLHAAHVLGGIAALSWVAVLAWRGRYSSVYHPGVFYQVMYWHFVGAVWLVIVALMLAW